MRKAPRPVAVRMSICKILLRFGSHWSRRRLSQAKQERLRRRQGSSHIFVETRCKPQGCKTPWLRLGLRFDCQLHHHSRPRHPTWISLLACIDRARMKTCIFFTIMYIQTRARYGLNSVICTAPLRSSFHWQSVLDRVTLPITRCILSPAIRFQTKADFVNLLEKKEGNEAASATNPLQQGSP